jgi:hypothetical protein
MSTPEKKQHARYALHTPRLALRAVAFVLLFVSWALYIRRAVKCQEIMNLIRHEKNPPKNLASDQAVCWDQKNYGALRPFLLDLFALLWSAAVFAVVAVNKVGMHPGVDCAADVIFGLAILGSSGELYWVVARHPFNARATLQNAYLLAATLLATFGA